MTTDNNQFDEEEKLLNSTPDKLEGFDRYKPYVRVSTTRHPLVKAGKVKSQLLQVPTSYVSYLEYNGTRIWVSEAVFYVRDHGEHVKEMAKREALRVMRMPPSSKIAKILEAKCADIDYRKRIANPTKQQKIKPNHRPRRKPSNS